jgi:hypothetical protein
MSEIGIRNRSFIKLLITWHGNGRDAPVLNAPQGPGLFAGKKPTVLRVILEFGKFAGDCLVSGDDGFEFGGFLFVCEGLFGRFDVFLVLEVTRDDFKLFVGHNGVKRVRIGQKLLYEMRENYIIR